MTGTSRLSLALLVLFVLSGFAGLIYQSVWSQYLGLTLGHAAYAQTLVLAIFMGGMAVGAWLASRYSLRWRRLILGYAVVEAVIGVFGLVFHPLFVAYTGISQESVLPALDSPVLAHAYQWLTATALITPQSVLLGATFPLMSAGLIRAMPNAQGEVLGGLYFSNSLGAALGALLATFLLLPLVGLPGTVMTAGILNILVAALAWLIGKRIEDSPHASYPPAAVATASGSRKDAGEGGSTHIGRLGRVLMWSTAVSGAASFVYEVGWVRLLNQALGATIHSFELMLAAFILGLAFGGLWIRKRAAGIEEPVRYVGYVQVWMAIAALLSIPVFTQSFQWVGWIMSALSRSDNGYVLYELATAGIALLVMFPAAFLAGMTLPLFTLALLRSGADERAIGRIYAANTLGAIIGVALAMHVLIPLIGVRLAVTLAALVDGLVGLYLLRAINPARLTKLVAGMALLLVAAVGVSVPLGKPDPVMQASGVFRTGLVRRAGAEVEFLRDGKTATVSVFTVRGFRIIATNGKPDAGLSAMDSAPSGDEITMTMAGVLPLALHPAPKDIAVIGWGSGLTTHTLLGSPVPQKVDTVEIESAMVDGARLFGDRVSRAYNDPRSHVRIDDARTFFSTGARQYDVIISEPSNPWVSGVAGLFTQEFYAFLKRHLRPDGMLVQWIHIYEINDALVGTMLAALAAEFPHADLYLTNDSDVLIVARTNGAPLTARPAAVRGSALEKELVRVGIDRVEQIQLRHIGGIDALRNLLRMQGARPHSDYYPTVALNAPRARFRNDEADALPRLVANGMPVMDILGCRKPVPASASLAEDKVSAFASARQLALQLAISLQTGEMHAQLLDEPSNDAVQGLSSLTALSQRVAASPVLLRQWGDGAAGVARVTIGHLAPEDLSVWTAAAWLPPEAMRVPEVSDLMAAYAAASRRSPREMRAAAEQVLRRGEKFSNRVQEQMLVIAMLGALGQGDHAGAEALERTWGDKVGRSQAWMPVRTYLLAWSDAKTPICAQSPPTTMRESKP